MYQEYTKAYQKNATSAGRKQIAQIGLGLLVYLLASSFVSLEVSVAIQKWFPQSALFPYAYQLLPAILGYAAGIPLFYTIVCSVPMQKPARQKLGFTNWMGFLAIAFLLMNIGSYIAAFLMGFFEAFRGTEIANAVEQQISQSSPLVNVITAVVLAPIIEELLCRKWIIDRLMPYSEWAAALTSALFFGLIHGNFYQFFYAFLVGFLFAVVYIKTGNILHTILMHAIVNFTSAIVSQALSNQMESTLSISPWALMTGLYTIALYGLVVCGIFFLAHYVRRGKLEKEGPLKLPLSKQFSCIFLNWGTPILLLFCGALFFFSLFI